MLKTKTKKIKGNEAEDLQATGQMLEEETPPSLP